MLQTLRMIFFAALMLGVVFEFPYLVKNLGFPSALVWVWFPWPMKAFMPSGTEYDRVAEDVPGWILVFQAISMWGFLAMLLLGKIATLMHP